MRNVKKLGLVGRVILGVGAVGSLVSGCNDIVASRLTEAAAYSVIASGAERTINPNEVNVNVGQGSGVSTKSAFYFITDFKTGKHYVQEGRYDSLGPDFDNIYREQWDQLHPDGYFVQMFKDNKAIGTIRVKYNKSND